jgi:primosomal protein N' (replication factor Y)
MDQRRQFMYPPFSRLIHIQVKHKDYKIAAQASFQLKQMLFTKLGEGVVGPESPYVGRVKNMFIKELLIKISRERSNLGEMKHFIRVCIQSVLQHTDNKGSIITVNVDPL